MTGHAGSIIDHLPIPDETTMVITHFLWKCEPSIPVREYRFPRCRLCRVNPLGSLDRFHKREIFLSPERHPCRKHHATTGEMLPGRLLNELVGARSHFALTHSQGQDKLLGDVAVSVVSKGSQPFDSLSLIDPPLCNLDRGAPEPGDRDPRTARSRILDRALRCPQASREHAGEPAHSGKTVPCP